MNFNAIFKAPALALIAALGVTMVSGEAAAQQERQQQDQPEQQQQCRAILSPSSLTAPSEQTPEEQRRQQRIAGKVTLQARLTQDIGNVTEVKVEEGSEIQVSLAKEEHQQDEARQHEETQQQETQQQEEEQRQQQRSAEMAQNRVPLEVDVSQAREGEWKVTFMGEGNQECTGTLRIRGANPAR